VATTLATHSRKGVLNYRSRISLTDADCVNLWLHELGLAGGVRTPPRQQQHNESIELSLFFHHLNTIN